MNFDFRLVLNPAKTPQEVRLWGSSMMLCKKLYGVHQEERLRTQIGAFSYGCGLALVLSIRLVAHQSVLTGAGGEGPSFGLVRL